MLKTSKTQKGFIALLLIIIIVIIALMFFGVIRSTAMHGCVSKTASCFNHSSGRSGMETLVDMFICIVKAFGCVILSFWDMLTGWIRHFF